MYDFTSYSALVACLADTLYDSNVECINF